MRRAPGAGWIPNPTAGSSIPSRRAVAFERYCGRKYPLSRLTYDHVIPRAQGGRTNWQNVVMACYACNGKKGHRTPEQARMRLLKEPVKPKWLPIVAFRIDPTCGIPDAWTSWLYWHGALEEDLVDPRN